MWILVEWMRVSNPNLTNIESAFDGLHAADENEEARGRT